MFQGNSGFRLRLEVLKIKQVTRGLIWTEGIYVYGASSGIATL